MTIAVGAPGDDCNGSNSGHARVFTYSSTTNKWNSLGNALVGAALDDYF